MQPINTHLSETASFDHETSPTITLNVSASTAGDLESDYHIVTVTVTDVNEAPVGDLIITGTLTEGETLTADSSGVSDEDGMNMTDETYQWYSGGAACDGAAQSPRMSSTLAPFQGSAWITSTSQGPPRL